MYDKHSLRRFLLLPIGLISVLAGVCRAEQELLLPDQAFRISGQADAADAVVAE